jgi:hypothetical protein
MGCPEGDRDTPTTTPAEKAHGMWPNSRILKGSIWYEGRYVPGKRIFPRLGNLKGLLTKSNVTPEQVAIG